jgi:hypothetical protein
MNMNEEEILEALLKGAILNVSDSGDVQIQTLDDLPPAVRECFRASKEHDRDHQRACPDCLDNEADNTLMDAASHRQDGNEEIALELEAEAAEIGFHAATLRKNQFVKADASKTPKPISWRTLLHRIFAPFRSLSRMLL